MAIPVYAQERRPEFIFRGDWTEEVKAIIGPLLEEYAYILPPWVRQVYVRCGDLENSTAAQTRVQYKHRWTAIKFDIAAVLQQRDRERRRIVVHEFVHALLDPMAGFVSSITKFYVGDTAEKFLDEEWEERLEMATEDITWALLGYGKEPPE